MRNRNTATAILSALSALALSGGCMTYVRTANIHDSRVDIAAIRTALAAQVGVQTRGQHIPDGDQRTDQEGGGRADVTTDLQVPVGTPSATDAVAPVTSTPVTTPTNSVSPVSSVSTGDFAGVTFLGLDVSGWSQTATLTASMSGGKVTLDYDKASVWAAVDGAVANPWAIVDYNGQRYAATWEWLKPGQTLKDMSGKSWSGHFKRGELSGWEPTAGDRIGLFVSGLCRDTRRNVSERSNIVWVTVE
jgi:hypothetical protein